MAEGRTDGDFQSLSKTSACPNFAMLQHNF